MTRYLLALSLVATMAACDTSTDGANGAISFTPTDCGPAQCDFDNSVGVGGTLSLNIAGNEGVVTASATVESDDPTVLSIQAIAGNGEPTWELVGMAAGIARLTVFDVDHGVIDFLEVGVQNLSGLTANNIIGDAVGPTEDEFFDEVWTVNAGEEVDLQVVPVIGDGVATMGRYTYTATVDAAIEDGLIGDRLSEGYLRFNVVAGDHSVTFDDDYGHQLRLLIKAQ